MKKEKKEKKSNLSMMIGIAILFVFAFIMLIGKQIENERELADMVDNEFYLHTIPSKQIVVKDLEASYPRYYVFFYDDTDHTYIVHSFNYYQTDSQYEMEYNNHLKYILDYNYDIYMIRYIFDEGQIDDYESLLEDISLIIDSNNYKIY